ncbi:MAG TPA: hypothetical protein VMX58_11615 [Patescibacteria group bacterium]|nr:hypothetical protein [Patescibacteria group bacterium]
MWKSLCRMMLLWAIVAPLTLGATPLSGQEFEEMVLVDSPTAGILPHGAYLFQGSFGPRSSLIFGVKIGFHDRIMVGVSFGMQEFIGTGDIEINDKPGFEVRLRIIEESLRGPALAVGIDTQGEDAYLEDDERYERKSKGFYAVISKNYQLLSDFSVHGGVNYSLENKDEESLNPFGGLSIELIDGFSILVDYNAALDDDNADVPSHRTRGRGYLDSGIRFDYMENLRLKILFKDLMGNYEPEKGVARSVEILYINYF